MPETNNMPKPNSWSQAAVLFFVIVMIGTIFVAINTELGNRPEQSTSDREEFVEDEIPRIQNVQVLVMKINAIESHLPRMRTALMRIRKMDNNELNHQERAMAQEIANQEKNLREMKQLLYQWKLQQGPL